MKSKWARLAVFAGTALIVVWNEGKVSFCVSISVVSLFLTLRMARVIGTFAYHLFRGAGRVSHVYCSVAFMSGSPYRWCLYYLPLIVLIGVSTFCVARPSSRLLIIGTVVAAFCEVVRAAFRRDVVMSALFSLQKGENTDDLGAKLPISGAIVNCGSQELKDAVRRAIAMQRNLARPPMVDLYFGLGMWYLIRSVFQCVRASILYWIVVAPLVPRRTSEAVFISKLREGLLKYPGAGG